MAPLAQFLQDAGRHLPAWFPLLTAVLGIVALSRGRMKAGCALGLGACALGLLSAQRFEPWFNAVNQGATGVPTIRLVLSLGALAWLGGILAEGGAAAKLAGTFTNMPSGLKAVLAPLFLGLMPGHSHRPAEAEGWFSRIPGLALPVGAALVLAADLGGLTLGQASRALLPLAIALLAVGLLCFAPREKASAAGFSGAGLKTLIPVLLAVALAFLLPQWEIPGIRAATFLHRTVEGLAGLLTPLATGAFLGGMVAARALGLGPSILLKLLKRAFSPDLLALAAGAKILEQVGRVQASRSAAPYNESAVQSAAAVLEHLGPAAPLAALAVPAVLAFVAGDVVVALACTLPFLSGSSGSFTLICAGAWLGAALAPRETRRAIALPAALGALAAALLSR